MAEPIVVRTRAGALAGTTVETPSGTVERFAGVPFGTAPVGAERFRAARPASAWAGVRPAIEFGPSPCQATSGPFAGSVPGMAVHRVDEDCLTLNIWRPARPADEPMPVMVWIYGGAFVAGGAAAPTYDGARLCAEQGVVVVTFNYRVGMFGFLDLRAVRGGVDTDTNCGLHDQLLALQWVHEHIAVFGGEPARVTVFGESAGAGSIMHLLTVPGIGALVRGAVAQSPGIDFTQTPSLSAVVARAVLARAGVSDVDGLRALPAARLVEIQEAVAGELLFDLGTMIFHPVVDDSFVTATPSVALAGGAADNVALLLGSTADEMRLFPDPRADDLDEDGLTAWVRGYLTHRMGRDPGEAVAAGLAGAHGTALRGTARPRGSDRWAAIQTEGIIRQPVLRVADSRPAAAATFVYEFDWSARGTGGDLGAFHAIELPFVFDAFDVDGWGAFVGIDDAGRALGRAMRTAWAAFAATGDPSAESLGGWPRYEPGQRWTMVLDEDSHPVADPRAVERGWWEGLWDPACRPASVPL
ncbi:MAG: Carboxylesterase type [Ilumatobacteraceae bacterium]|nr:Carboxylesterase type [Ilumatobacteraceae bacterium]